jgi:hypothetical protein
MKERLIRNRDRDGEERKTVGERKNRFKKTEIL